MGGNLKWRSKSLVRQNLIKYPIKDIETGLCAINRSGKTGLCKRDIKGYKSTNNYQNIPDKWF